MLEGNSTEKLKEELKINNELTTTKTPFLPKQAF